jgi:hypothetical protein
VRPKITFAEADPRAGRLAILTATYPVKTCKSLRDSHHVLELFPANLAATNRPCDGLTKNTNAIPNCFFALVHAYAFWASHHTAAIQGPYSDMRNEHSRRGTPRSPLCPSCAHTMRLARTTPRFEDPIDLYIFECRACGVFDAEDARTEAA